MLKMNASYSKKVPAESQYSSQSYHVSLEVELPNQLTPAALQQKIHETFELARTSVETEIQGKQAPIDTTPVPAARQVQQCERASTKQIKYLVTLLRRNDVSMQETLEHYHIKSLDQLSKAQCSALIDHLQKQPERVA